MTAYTDTAFDRIVEAEANGWATPEQVAALEADPDRWRDALLDLLDDTEDGLESVRASVTGPERAQVIADFESEVAVLRAALIRLTGADPAAETEVSGGPAADEAGPAEEDDEPASGLVRLHLSWTPGRVVAWAAGPRAPSSDHDELRSRLAAADAPAAPWTPHAPVALPDGEFADALAAPVADVLGWLVAVGAGVAGSTELPDDDDRDEHDDHDDHDDHDQPGGSDDAERLDAIGPAVTWLGRVALWAVEATMQGAMVPLLRQRRRSAGRGGDTAAYSVRWTPALVDPKRLQNIAAAMPGAVAALDQSVDARSIAKSALTGMVDAICRDAARRVEVPAPSPRPRTPSDVAEAFLGHLDGGQFEAPVNVGSDLVADLERWARPVTGTSAGRLVVQLDPPDSGNAWMLSVLATGTEGHLVPVEVAIVNAGPQRAQLEQELNRLERLLPVLRRPGGLRRGDVVVSQDEAWELMTVTGPLVADAGFDVRVPSLSKKKPTPSLRLLADSMSTQTSVGAHQLADVRWSAVFDDVELTAAEIQRLAAEARPLVRSGGRWVALDHADLRAAAEALAERANKTRMTGADMLRHALGLEGSPLAGGISVAGNGWAADLLARASTVTNEPAPAPEGFVGTLRSYQGEALAWLNFIDSVDLGGCLALDMGLGKTPTMLAHLQAGAGNGPALVIAPPAVVGNWAAEAARFTPKLRVLVHHGATRASAHQIKNEAGRADVIITTYGTALRDIEALEAVAWERLVLDEAQAIKNPASSTAQELRRINARSRVALTGTPIENGLGDLWAILDYTNPGLVGPRPAFIAQLSAKDPKASDKSEPEVGDDGSANGNGAKPATRQGEDALRALNGILVFRRTKSEPSIAAELPDRIDELDHCAMTPEQIGLYQAVLDQLVTQSATDDDLDKKKGAVLAAITALKQICNHPVAFRDDGGVLEGRSGKLARLDEIVDAVFAADERVLVFTHFAQWGEKLARHLSTRTRTKVECYHGGLSRGARDKIISDFQSGRGPGALVLSLKAGGTGLNLTAASHVVLYDRWWNPAVEDQARDRAWRIGQTRTVISHRLVCPGTVDERVEEVVAGKRRIAELVLPKSSSLADLDSSQLRVALGLRPDQVLTEEAEDAARELEEAAVKTGPAGSGSSGGEEAA